MSVSANFNTFCDNLKVSENKKAIISLRFNAICEKLNKDYWKLNSTYGGIYVGSYGRQTENTWVNEVEMIFEMPMEIKNRFEAFRNDSQFAFLTDIEKSIGEIYPSAKIDRENNTVKIRFSDKIVLYVLPVFRNIDDTYCYANLSEQGSWDRMDPIAEIKAMHTANKSTNNNLVNLCKMVRAWKKHNNVLIKDILIDTLVSEFLLHSEHKECVYEDYDKMCLGFFKFLKEQDPLRTEWNAVGSNALISNPDNFRYKSIIAYHKIESAMEFETKKKSWRARQKWREVFGTKFPESIILEQQLRKLSQKTVKLQKTQIKCAVILKQKTYRSKLSQLVLALMVVTGILIIGYTNQFNFGLVLFGVSSMLFLASIYIQKTNLAGIINRHKKSAVQLYHLEQNAKKLLQDLNSKHIELAVLNEQKEKLQEQIRSMYTGTTMFINKTYLDAANALNPLIDEKHEIMLNSNSKIHVPIWQGNKFYLENHVHML